MSQTFTVLVNGTPMFYSATGGNAWTIHDKIEQRVPGVTVAVKRDTDTLTNPTFPEALEFLAGKGFTVLDKGAKAPAAEPTPEPVKVAAVRKVTTRATRTPAATTTRKAPTRKKVAAASK